MHHLFEFTAEFQDGRLVQAINIIMKHKAVRMPAVRCAALLYELSMANFVAAKVNAQKVAEGRRSPAAREMPARQTQPSAGLVSGCQWRAAACLCAQQCSRAIWCTPPLHPL